MNSREMRVCADKCRLVGERLSTSILPNRALRGLLVRHCSRISAEEIAEFTTTSAPSMSPSSARSHCEGSSMLNAWPGTRLSNAYPCRSEYDSTVVLWPATLLHETVGFANNRGSVRQSSFARRNSIHPSRLSFRSRSPRRRSHWADRLSFHL